MLIRDDLDSKQAPLWQAVEKRHFICFPHPSPFDVPTKYTSRLRISGALPLDIFNGLQEKIFNLLWTATADHLPYHK
jgi:hypothetical protein